MQWFGEGEMTQERRRGGVGGSRLPPPSPGGAAGHKRAEGSEGGRADLHPRTVAMQ